MTEFEVDDRVEYVGNNDGVSQIKTYIGRTGTVEYAAPGLTRVKWDDGTSWSHYNENLRKVGSPDKGETQREVMDRYVSELNSIFVSGTFVPHYTAVGLLAEFVREWDGAK